MAALDIEDVRRQMAYVSQEPQLFSSSIGDNIARGDTTRLISDVCLVKVLSHPNHCA
jgi:ABC-type multidrug transport system fused ATPase/permease subunit